MGRLIGYARVSTDEQDTIEQREALRAHGCVIVFSDVGSGASQKRPELKRCMATLAAGDTLVVTRLDRLARSVEHLYTVMRELRERKISFSSMRETFDTRTAAGELMFGMLTLIAQFERNLIHERSRAGITAAQKRGVAFGNPRMKARDPIAIATMKATMSDTILRRYRERSQGWIAMVTRLRPTVAWPQVHQRIAKARPNDAPKFTTMMRVVTRLVEAGDMDPQVLGRARRTTNESAAVLARRMAAENPDMSLRAIARELDAAGVRPVRAATWSAQTVKQMLATTASDAPRT